jgi:hypothetical protein
LGIISPIGYYKSPNQDILSKGPAIKKFMPWVVIIGAHDVLRNFWILSNLYEILISPTWNQKKYCALFVDVFSCTISSWNFFFHKYDISNNILVFIHVKKTFRALQCQKCGTFFKKNWGITKHLQKSMKIFNVSSQTPNS